MEYSSQQVTLAIDKVYYEADRLIDMGILGSPFKFMYYRAVNFWQKIKYGNSQIVALALNNKFPVLGMIALISLGLKYIPAHLDKLIQKQPVLYNWQLRLTGYQAKETMVQ